MLTLRKITSHPHVTDAYRVVHDGIEIGSIGKQLGAYQREFWAWGIDTILPQQVFATDGEARDRVDAMAQFKAAWEVFASDQARLAYFMEMKRRQ